MPDRNKILQDISLLYELSLSVGSTLDPMENCLRFFRTLISRKNLSFCSLWLPHTLQDDQLLCDLFCIHPQFRQEKQTVSCSIAIHRLLQIRPFVSISHKDPLFQELIHEKKVGKGSYAIFRMGDLGFLKLFASNRPEGFSEAEMAQLKQVVDKLKISLDGCFAHVRIKEETEQRLVAQKALEVSNQRYEDLFNNVYDALIVQDKYGNILEGNAAAWNLVGLSKTALKTKNVLDIAHPEDVEKVREHGWNLKETGAQTGLEIRVLNQEGEVRYVQVNSSAIYENGQYAGSRDIARDITEQKRSQDLLIASETKLRQILDSSLEAIFSVDLDGLIQEWNAQAERMFGYGREEVIGKHLARMIIPERLQEHYQQQLRQFIERAEARILNQRFEIKCVNKEGVEFHAELSVNADKDSRSTLFIGFIRDITEQKKAKREIEKARVRMENLISNLQSAILLEDDKRRIGLVNSVFCDLFSIPVDPETLVGQDCAQAAYQSRHLFSDPDAFVEGIARAVQAKKLIKNETLVMADGRILERDFIPLFSGEVYQGHLWHYRDVTEQHNTQKAIRESEEKYRGILENMELGLLEVDMEETILRCNNALSKMLGFTPEELIGKKTFDTVLTDQSNEVIRNKVEERRQGKASAYEMTLRKKDGSFIWGLVSGAPVKNSHGQIVGSIGIHFDLSARKKLETDLAEATMSAERARLAERQFLTHMSHEIRTPINAVIGMTHLLYETSPTPIQKEYLESLRFSADTLLVIVDDILDLSKIDAGAIEFEQKNFDLAYLLIALHQTFQYKVQGKEVEIILELDPRLQHFVIGDPTRLNQILTNLLGNAVKFTAQGSIILTMRLLKESVDGMDIEFRVKDTGIGIPADKQSLIFENFRQADLQISRKFGGTGLGLTIVKQLVELQGGAIRVESEYGKGSTFIFNLPFGDSGIPIVPQAIPKSGPPEEPMPSLEGLRFLVVEDNILNQKLICHTLRTWNSDFQVANNGVEALALTAQYQFDVILMDIHMPEMDGCETTLAIRRDEENVNQNVPIIALTAAAMPEEKRMALEAGMNGFLTKPFSPKTLQSYIVQALPGDKTRSKPEAERPEGHHDHLFNLAHLNEISSGDQSFIREILEAFLSETPAVLINMQKLAEIGDWPNVGKLAHRLKPNFGLLGMDNLQQTAAALETRIKSGEWNAAELEALAERLIADAHAILPLIEKARLAG